MGVVDAGAGESESERESEREETEGRDRERERKRRRERKRERARRGEREKLPVESVRPLRRSRQDCVSLPHLCLSHPQSRRSHPCASPFPSLVATSRVGRDHPAALLPPLLRRTRFVGYTRDGGEDAEGQRYNSAACKRVNIFA